MFTRAQESQNITSDYSLNFFGCLIYAQWFMNLKFNISNFNINNTNVDTVNT